MTATDMSPARHRAEAYALLTLTMLFWGAHAVVGRMAVGEISPMLLAGMRWSLVLSILVLGVWQRLRNEWPALVANWRKIFVMGAVGFTGFNAFFYVAAYHTTGVNMAIFQGSIPIFVVLGAFFFQGVRIGAFQILGTAITLVGVAVAGTRGELRTLTTLGFNIGDLLMLLACACYGGYAVALRDRPKVSGVVLFTGLSCAAFLTSIPLVAYEFAAGRAQWPTATGWVLLVLVAVFPSFLAQVFFIRAVGLIGAGRAGLFVNLVPVFGAALAVLILSEPFAPYHVASLALVLGGILLAETGGAFTRGPRAEP